MLKKRCGDRWVIPVYLLVALFYFWLAAQIPYSHDDWDWGSDVGMQQFLYATLNSRYSGNFFVVILTRFPILKIGIMGATFFAIPFCLSRLSLFRAEKVTPWARLWLFIVSNAFMLSVNQIMWRETYSWVSGFANYVVSVLFLLLWARELLVATADTPPTGSSAWMTALLYGVLCFCGQLFLENVAIYCVLLALALFIIYRKRCGRIPLRIWMMLGGAIVGLLVMFSSSVYDTLLQNGSAIDEYREIPLISGGGIGLLVYRTAVAVLNLGVRLYSRNPLLMIAVLLCLVWRLCRMPQSQRPGCVRWFVWVDGLLAIAFAASGMYDRFCIDHASWVYHCEFGLSVCFFIAVFWQTIVLFRGAWRLRMLCVWLSAPMVIAPLVATTEHGYRLFFTAHVFIHLFVLLLLADAIRQADCTIRKAVQSVGVMVAAILIGFYAVIYTCVGLCNRERLDIIDTAVQNGETTISLPAFPFSEYLFFPDPKNEWRIPYFAEFYGIPEDVAIIFESSLE